MKVELDLSNYSTKADLKNATDVDTRKSAKKVDLTNLKSDVDKLDIDKLKNEPTNLSNLKNKVDKLDVDKLVLVPVNLNKLSDVVKNYVVKKDVYNASNNLQRTEDKMPDITNATPIVTNLATTTALNAKINEVKNKIPNITNLATTTTLTAVENKIPNVCNLVKKNNSEIENNITTVPDHDKYVTAQ